MSKKVKFLRNGSDNWIGIKFPNRKGAVWVSQSDFDVLVDTIISGLNLTEFLAPENEA